MADVFRRLIGDLPGAFGAMDRLAIRRSIASALGGDVLDLAKRPQVEGWFISVSHSGDVGGWVAARTPIGFDVERIARLRPELIARVATPAEIAAAPEPKWLWPAKEAAFKAMNPQPATLPQIHVTSWNALGFETAFGAGHVAPDDELVFALFHAR